MAVAAISEKVAQAKKLLNEAAEIALNHQLEFSWDGPGDDGYGFGGNFIPSRFDEYENGINDCWVSSTSQC